LRRLQVTESQTVSLIQLAGAVCFGLVIGWYVYYLNRYRKGDVQLSDLVTLVGVLGGGAVLALFPAKSDLFGAYGVGLALGFFAYFVVLIILVAMSPNFSVDWFLDGRRKAVAGDEERPGDVEATIRPMGTTQAPKPGQTGAAASQAGAVAAPTNVPPGVP
jgi:hypothetical protein